MEYCSFSQEWSPSCHAARHLFHDIKQRDKAGSFNQSAMNNGSREIQPSSEQLCLGRMGATAQVVYMFAPLREMLRPSLARSRGPEQFFTTGRLRGIARKISRGDKFGEVSPGICASHKV
jgi:hypothetical protein